MLGQLALYITLLAVAAVESATLAILVPLRQRSERGMIPFVVMLAAVALWQTSYALELLNQTLEAKLFWTQLEYVGIVIAPTASLIFLMDYLGAQRWLTRRNLILLMVMPLATILLIWTNEVHHLFWSTIFLTTDRGILMFSDTFGPWFWIHSAYTYTVALAAAILLIHHLRRAPQLYRGQAATLLLGLFAPWIGNAVYLMGFSPLGKLDLTPFCFTITGAAFAWSMISYRLLDVIPAARDSVVEGIKDAVIVLDGRNRIVDMNPAAQRVIGVSLSKAVGSLISELVPQHRALIDRYRNQRELQTEIEVPIDGEQRTFELSLTDLKDRQGKPTGRLVMLHDITEQRMADEALSRAHEHALEALRVKSRILAIVSHDFRTPLSSIIGYSDMLSRQLHGTLTEPQLTFVQRIQTSAIDLTGLVTDLLDQARLDESAITLNYTYFEPQRLVDQLREKVEHKAKEKQLGLRFEIDPNIAAESLYGDLARLDQVAVNILTNAIKFTEKGEVVTRVFKHGDHQWGLRISDTGPGMNADVLAHIFEPFWQADARFTREHSSGVGLGLSIAKQLTAMMEGELKVESKLGEGTVFEVLLSLKSMRERINEGKV